MESEILYQRRFLLRPYIVQADEADKKTVEFWQMPVDHVREYVQGRYASHFGAKHKVVEYSDKPYLLTDEQIQRAIGEEPTESDITLFGIGTFVLRFYPPFSFIRSGLRLACGGRFSLMSYGNDSTCIEASVLTEQLAKNYGIEGQVKKLPWEYHHYWQETGGLERIVDATQCWNRNGLVLDPTQFNAIRAENRAQVKAYKRGKK